MPVRTAGRGRTEVFRKFRFRPRPLRSLEGDRIGEGTEGSNKRTVVQAEIPVTGRVPMVTCILRKPTNWETGHTVRDVIEIFSSRHMLGNKNRVGERNE